MANEAQLRLRTTDPVPFTVADAVAITKGALLTLTDPRTAILATGAGTAIAGIAAADKVANDGQTELAVYTNGWFDITASGAIALGAPCCVGTTGSLNYVSGAAMGANQFFLSGAAICGHALETASDNEVFLMALNLG